MIRRPPRSTLFPTRRSSDLLERDELVLVRAAPRVPAPAGQLDRRLDRLGARVAEVRAAGQTGQLGEPLGQPEDRKSTRLNSSHANISYAVFCLKKKKKHTRP